MRKIQNKSTGNAWSSNKRVNVWISAKETAEAGLYELPSSCYMAAWKDPAAAADAI